MRDFLQWHAFGLGFVPDVVSKISSVSSSTSTRICRTGLFSSSSITFKLEAELSIIEKRCMKEVR